MPRSKEAGGSRLRAAFVTAVAALTVSAVGASGAQAAATITLDHGFLKIGGVETALEVITPATPITLNTADDLPGAFTVLNTADVNEIQTITANGSVTGGTYTITVDPPGLPPAETTGPIAHDAAKFNSTPAVDSIADKLGELPNVGYFDIKLTGGELPGSPLQLEFVGAAFYGTDQPNVVVDSNFVGVGTYDVAEDNPGARSKSPFDFPQFEGDLGGFPLAVDVRPQSNVTGTYDGAGAMSTSATGYLAKVAVGPPLNIECDYPVTLALSTADNTIFKGDVFDAASNPPLNGVLTDDWGTLPGGCGTLDAFTAGPGGLWLSNGVPTPTLQPKPVPQSTPVTTTPKKKCKKGQKLVKGKCKKKKKKKKKK